MPCKPHVAAVGANGYSVGLAVVLKCSLCFNGSQVSTVQVGFRAVPGLSLFLFPDIT